MNNFLITVFIQKHETKQTKVCMWRRKKMEKKRRHTIKVFHTKSKWLYLWPFPASSHREYPQSQSHASLQLLGKESPGEIIWIDAQKIAACLKSCPLYFARSLYHVWVICKTKTTRRERKQRGKKKTLSTVAISDSCSSSQLTKPMVINWSKIKKNLNGEETYHGGSF